jgi:hypothetical protein
MFPNFFKLLSKMLFLGPTYPKKYGHIDTSYPSLTTSLKSVKSPKMTETCLYLGTGWDYFSAERRSYCQLPRCTRISSCGNRSFLGGNMTQPYCNSR